jgi:hypothetical protein
MTPVIISYSSIKPMKSPSRSTHKVIDVKARERMRKGVRTFIDRLGLEWFLEGNGDRLSFKIKDRRVERCAMWLCDEKELVETDSSEGTTDFYLRIRNPEELESYKRMVRREVLRYVKNALER